MARISQFIPAINTMIANFMSQSNNEFKYETSDLETDSGSSSSESSENYFDPSEKGIRPDYSEDYSPDQVISRFFLCPYWSSTKVAVPKLDDMKRQTRRQ